MNVPPPPPGPYESLFPELPRSIDLNADLGEGFPNDPEVLRRVTSASLACGAHAGDAKTVRSLLRVARRHRVALGAHPGYPDREHFGRREQDWPPGPLRDEILTQVETLGLWMVDQGETIRFLKPHGALYNQAQRDRNVATAIVSVASILGLPLLGQPGTILESLAREQGLTYITEGFIERRYGPDGLLVPRDRSDAVLTDPVEIAAQILELVDRGVATLCIHGDRPDAVAMVDLALRTLQERSIPVRTFVRSGPHPRNPT